MARLSFRCDEALIEKLDLVRGEVPRERWLRAMVEEQLAGAKKARKSSAPVRASRAAGEARVEAFRKISQPNQRK